MKKLISSKTFIAGTLAILCVVILVVCLLWSKGDKPDFIPDPVPSGAPIDSWTENSTSPNGETDKNGFTPADYPSGSQSENTSAGEYPAVIEDKEKEVIIAFIDPEPTRESPPETPGTNNDMPSQPPDHVGKPQENPDSGKPIPGSTNEKGEVYDRVFGWVKPGVVEQIEGDSPGDPNKIIGNMN